MSVFLLVSAGECSSEKTCAHVNTSILFKLKCFAHHQVQIRYYPVRFTPNRSCVHFACHRGVLRDQGLLVLYDNTVEIARALKQL